ncbi:MAG: hypothetical protein Q4C64_01350 [Erysipelotrichia bacterium]|nr:hypothetical protein [Erysipelotrichia bacterium]
MKKIILIICVLTIITLFGCQDKNEKLIQQGRYKEAYENYCTVQQFEKADECILLWEKSIIDNEEMDNEFKNITFFSKDYRERYWDNIKEYLYDKVVPNKKESELIIYLVDNCEEVYTYIHQANFTDRTLKKLLTEEKIWYVPQWQSVSYEQYYSQEHFYTDSSVNEMLSADKNFFAYFDADEDGYKVVVCYEVDSQTKYKEQHIICGDYQKYNNLASIYDCDDGYWHYYLADNIIGRLNYKGETEEIYQLKEGEQFRGMFVLEHDIAYYLIENNNDLIICRTYLPEMKTDVFDGIITDKSIMSWTNLEVPPSSNYLAYSGYNPQYLEITAEFQNDRNEWYQLYDKYSYMLSQYNRDEILDRALDGDVRYRSVLLREYGIDFYATFLYNIVTETTTYITHEADFSNAQGEILF